MLKKLKKVKDNTLDNKNKFKKIFTKKRIILSIIALFVIFLIVISTIFLVRKISGEKEIISVNGVSYTKDDYMMYLRLAKTSLFDENTTRLPKATLNTIVDVENNINAETYLRNKTEENLKIAGAIKKIAKENGIHLDSQAYAELKEDKDNFIEKLGGKLSFYKFLWDNRTSEKAYDNIAEIDKLYKLVYDSLYAEGKSKDLTDKEKYTVKNNYELEYKKARQIFLLTVDTETKKEISPTITEQKKFLAESLRAELNENSDFNEYIKKYSDDATGKEPPYDMYFKSGQLLKILEETVDDLKENEISGVVKSEYGFHIIRRDPLDNEYLEKMYEDKREDNFLTDISDEIKNSKIIIQDSFTTLRVD